MKILFGMKLLVLQQFEPFFSRVVSDAGVNLYKLHNGFNRNTFQSLAHVPFNHLNMRLISLYIKG